MHPKSFYHDILFEFLRELPWDFDANTMTLKDCMDLIDAFCKKHGLE